VDKQEKGDENELKAPSQVRSDQKVINW